MSGTAPIRSPEVGADTVAAAPPGGKARSLARTHGLPWPDTLATRMLGAKPATAQPARTAPALAAVRLRCLGGFTFEVSGRRLDWRTVRPRAATMLRLLAIHLPLPVHREQLLQLWPDLSPDRAVHSMQVAVSSLRSVLAPGLPGGSPTELVRHGDAYALVLPPGSEADIVEFATGLRAATQARYAKDTPGLRRGAQHARHPGSSGRIADISAVRPTAPPGPR